MIGWRDRRLIGDQYNLRLDSRDTKSVEMGMGESQGYCLSPIPFILYREQLANEAPEEIEDFKIGGQWITTVDLCMHYGI